MFGKNEENYKNERQKGISVEIKTLLYITFEGFYVGEI